MSNVEFTSATVRGAQFREKLRGYNSEEVDAFLERAATALDQLADRLAEVTERALKAETALEKNSETDESVRRTLVLAQRTAEMAVREANEEAQRLRTDARNDADNIVQEAREEAARIMAEADEARATARAEADRMEQAAHEHATTTIDGANAEGARLRAETEAAITARREEGERAAVEAIETKTRALQRQYDLMWSDVERLSAFLGTERARVMTSLSEALEGFGVTLLAQEPPARESDVLGERDPVDVEPVVVGEADAPEAPAADVDDEPAVEAQGWGWPEGLAEPEPVEEPVTAWFAPADDEPAPVEAEAADVEADPDTAPVGEPAEWTGDPWAEPVHDDALPSRLLFTLEDETRRAEAERIDVTAEAKARKSLLGRRRG